MAILALLVEKPFWQDVFNKLAERNVLVTHVVALFHPDVGSMSYFKTHKPKALDTMKFFKLDAVSELTRKNTTVLDKKIIDYFTTVERDFYLLSDRYNYIPRSFRYKKRLFRESIRFWLSYLTEEKIDLVLLSCTPHDFSSFVAFHAAKYLGIKTLFFGHTMIADYVISESDYRDSYRVPADYLNNLSADEIKSKIPEKLLTRALAKNSFLEYSKFLNAQAISGENKMRPGGKELQKNRVALQDISHMELSDFREEINLLFMDKKVSPLLRRFIKSFDKKQIIKLKAEYIKRTSKPDFSEKYIYYSMHKQPERTATPNAEIFEDQTMAIEILARSVPEGWKVYVKEHPSQFHTKLNLFKGFHTRDASDYDDMLRYKNVRIMASDVQSKDLITNAQIVSTLCGSVGWETLQAGKPGILFANAWYGPCRSMIRVGSVEECKAAITELVQHTPEIVHLNMLKYLAYMSDKMMIGNLGDQAFVDSITVPYEEHVTSIADEIQTQYQARA